MRSILIALILPLIAFGADKHVPSTRERAAGMFRAPSGDEPQKIDRKFQPIDHVNKQPTDSKASDEKRPRKAEPEN